MKRIFAIEHLGIKYLLAFQQLQILIFLLYNHDHISINSFKSSKRYVKDFLLRE